MSAASPKRARVGIPAAGPGPSASELARRVAELETERDAWKAKALAQDGPCFPATHWPITKPSLSAESVKYPEYDRAKPKESFLAVCDMLIVEVCDELKGGYEVPRVELAWVRRLLDYNVRGGKLNRGLMVIESGVLTLEAAGKVADNTAIVRLAILGWCIEWMQAWLLIADDFMDESKTRRGQKCWYLHEDVQKIAVNDAFLLQQIVYQVLKRHFSSEPWYPQVVDLFLETTAQTVCGQLLDVLCVNMNIEEFTERRWELIVKYKTAFYSFYTPVALGMIMAGISDVGEFNAAREILLTMGVYFQAQDDYLDCYGTPDVIGKVGTDIADKKCGWLFVHAYGSLAKAEQKRVFDELYGKVAPQTPEEQRIKDMYTTLELPALYRKYEQESFDTIMRLRDTVKRVPWAVFESFLSKIYKRQK